MTQKFVALNGFGGRIISVYADSVEAADAEIAEQLNRPGRTGYLMNWRANGSFILLEDDTTNAIGKDGGTTHRQPSAEAKRQIADARKAVVAWSNGTYSGEMASDQPVED